MDINFHIPELVQPFSYVKNGGLNLGKPLTCMTVVSNSILLTTIREQNKQTYLVEISKRPIGDLPLSVQWSGCCLFDTFLISILNFMCHNHNH